MLGLSNNSMFYHHCDMRLNIFVLIWIWCSFPSFKAALQKRDAIWIYQAVLLLIVAFSHVVIGIHIPNDYVSKISLCF